ncbi:putative copper chaperone CsoZ [Staphylococcus ratti]|uniref:Heavy-metal-associated domain-containing protein n=1 Tax=Staphylococcus ratti TaxID=2892440 RepID=A0ABY3PEF0_9STAP|nr:heavy metal-associated domain-containing protein [Staphylococcus ratti]UEX90708.1 heavy-metal-associated domain-containing protein [Staphylococcus ratti]
MYKDIVFVEGIQSDLQKENLAQRLNQMIGVKEVTIDIERQSITLLYNTPVNLNTLEKEIYDTGYKVIRTEKGAI